jgi:hypothetical protein
MRLRTQSVLTALGFTATLAVCSALLFFARHRTSEPATAATADASFAELRSRFANQQPLLDMSQRRAVGSVATETDKPLHVFHTVIFDTRGGERLVRITAPYWFARAFARHDGEFRWLGELTFLDDTEFDPEEIRLSLREIERHGPGLIADYRHASGGRFIAWVD